MVRSTAISWKIGIAVATLALSLGQLQAQADDGLSEKLKTPPNSLEPKEVRVILLPAANDDVFASRRPALLDEAPIVMVQPAKKRATAELISEPVEIDDSATVVESPPAPAQPPRVASLPPVNDAAIASSPPVPEKIQKSAAPVVIPSLPGRSPFRQAPFKSEIVKNEPKDVAILQQQAPEPAPAKGNAAVRFLAKLWPGNKEASAPGASIANGNTSTDAGSKSEKSPIKRFLDGVQFWKN